MSISDSTNGSGLWDLDSFLLDFSSELTAIRRRLHQLAELATTEYETGAYLCRLLSGFGIPYQYPVADTGIVATIQGSAEADRRGDPAGCAETGRRSPCIALRAELDALPIFENSGCPFSSQHPGVMHACGHDAHMAIALGVAKFFKLHERDFSGCVKLFFQPAEETIGGAKPMIEAGCMENPKVDYVLGLHLAPYLETGDIEVRYDNMYAASDEVRITLHGKSSHGAYPEAGVDAIAMAASLISTLQTIVSRNVPPAEPCVLSFGLIQGGNAHNILADRVDLNGTLRTVTPDMRLRAKELIRRHVTSAATAYGGEGTAVFVPGYDALINTNPLVDLLRDVAIPLLGPEHVRWKSAPGMGVEDFSFFLHQAPGVFFHLGCGNREKGITAPLHSPGFAIDEDCLAVGVRVMASLAGRLLDSPAGSP